MRWRADTAWPRREDEMPSYPARLTEAEDGLVLVRFPDVPEAVTCGRGKEDAIRKAGDVLEVILGCYEAEGRPLPKPSAIADAPVVEVRRFRR